MEIDFLIETETWNAESLSEGAQASGNSKHINTDTDTRGDTDIDRDRGTETDTDTDTETDWHRRQVQTMAWAQSQTSTQTQTRDILWSKIRHRYRKESYRQGYLRIVLNKNKNSLFAPITVIHLFFLCMSVTIMFMIIRSRNSQETLMGLSRRVTVIWIII